MGDRETNNDNNSKAMNTADLLAPSGESTTGHPVNTAVEAVYRRYHSMLVGFLRDRLANKEEAEDMAQEIYRRLAGKPDVEQLEHQKAFLFKTARNLLIDNNRYRQRHNIDAHLDIDQLGPELASERSSPESDLAAKQELEIIDRALSELSPKCQAVFIMHRLDGCTYEAIAREIGISASMVEKYLGRALQHIRERVDGI